ncbi:MAG: hypothetical protein ACI9GM_000334 [Salibacteraceae bacterium]|jgi:hypothetical protein
MRSFSQFWMWVALVSVVFIASCEEKSDAKKMIEEVVEQTTQVIPSQEETAKFILMPPTETQVNFINKLPETPKINVLTYQYFHNGGGVAVGDINNDGMPDIYFSSNLQPNVLYLNKGGFKFENINAVAKATGEKGWSTGVTMVDINNDGLLDIYVCKSGKVDVEQRRNRLYINQGELKFIEQSALYGIDDPSYSTQAYFLDYDKDGDLDMYLLNHSISPIKPKSNNVDLTFDRDPFAGDKFFENKDGKFINVSEKVGVKGSPIGFGLSVSVSDYNNDGYPDLYVCNDYLERDYLYMNSGNKTFVDELKERTNHISNFSMGSDAADINNDGSIDIMVLDMAAKDNYRSKTNMSGMDQQKFEKYVENGLHYQYMINTLQLNKGDGTFSEVSQLAGVDKTDWSWSALFMDFDQDGIKDLYVTNGLRKEARNNDFVNEKKQLIEEMKRYPKQQLAYLKKILDKMPEQKIPNLLFKNDGKLHFAPVENSGLNKPSFSNGAAYADFDNDGDLDLVVNNIDHEAFIYKNVSKTKNYVAFKFKGTANNASGIGTKVTVISSNGTQVAEHYLTRGYQSSSYNKLHFGVGNSQTIDSVLVEWPNGITSVLTDVAVNQTVLIEESISTIKLKKRNDATNYKVTRLTELPFRHIENMYDDFEREVLLPHKMSEMGPALSVADVNGDGLEDFYVGGAIGQVGRLFVQSKNGKFETSNSIVIQPNAQVEECVSTFFDFDADGDLDLYIGTGGNESEEKNFRDFLYENKNGQWILTDALPSNSYFSTGTIAVNDFDNDGDLDMFIGTRQTPGKYPYASSSRLLENSNGVFTNVTATKASVLEDIGMVTSSSWIDVNGDSIQELVIAGEWMSVKVLEWKNGILTDVSDQSGFEEATGWWYSLESADIDNDGDLDLIAGNLGLNYKYQATTGYPFGLFYGDLNKDGKSDIVLSYAQDGDYFPLRGRQCSSQQIPEIKQKFPSYDLFGKSKVTEVYSGQLDSNQLLLVHDFSSAIFINNNGVFERKNLSHEWQYFNWCGVSVTDINGDGNLDLIAAGNLYEAEVETPRGDAGNGLVLLGNGKGDFTPLKTSDFNWGNSNVKSVEYVTIKGKPAFLIGSSNGPLKLLQFE